MANSIFLRSAFISLRRGAGCPLGNSRGKFCSFGSNSSSFSNPDGALLIPIKEPSEVSEPISLQNELVLFDLLENLLPTL